MCTVRATLSAVNSAALFACAQHPHPAGPIEVTTTKDRGVQHGHRHPHAWSIVEEKDLVRWILEEDLPGR